MLISDAQKEPKMQSGGIEGMGSGKLKSERSPGKQLSAGAYGAGAGGGGVSLLCEVINILQPK